MPADSYPAGSRWRVIKEGAYIDGMVPAGRSVQTGFRLDLEVGTILTSAGRSMTMGDGVPALKWREADNAWICNDALFHPHVGGIWDGYLPDPSYVERLP